MAAGTGTSTAGRRPVPVKTFILLGMTVALLAAALFWWAPRQRQIGAEEGYAAGVRAAMQALEAGDLSGFDLPAEDAVAFCDVAAEVKADGFTPARCNALIAEMIREAGSKGGEPAAEDGGK